MYTVDCKSYGDEKSVTAGIDTVMIHTEKQ